MNKVMHLNKLTMTAFANKIKAYQKIFFLKEDSDKKTMKTCYYDEDILITFQYKENEFSGNKLILHDIFISN